MAVSNFINLQSERVCSLDESDDTIRAYPKTVMLSPERSEGTEASRSEASFDFAQSVYEKCNCEEFRVSGTTKQSLIKKQI